MLKRAVTVAALVLCAAVSTAAQAKKCTIKQADAAEAMIDHLDSWEKVDQARKQFGHCDEGSISEGISGAITWLLTDRWATLPELAKLIKQDRALKPFVTRHLNGTIDTVDTDKIRLLATSSCPADLKGLCADLKKAAENAFK